MKRPPCRSRKKDLRPNPRTGFICSWLSKGRKEPVEVEEFADSRCARCVCYSPQEN